MIQVDGRFPEYRAAEVQEYLENGWEIADKTIIGERYINYILRKSHV